MKLHAKVEWPFLPLSNTGSLPPEDMTTAARRLNRAAGSGDALRPRILSSETRLPEKQLSDTSTICEAVIWPSSLPMSVFEIQVSAREASASEGCQKPSPIFSTNSPCPA